MYARPSPLEHSERFRNGALLKRSRRYVICSAAAILVSLNVAGSRPAHGQTTWYVDPTNANCCCVGTCAAATCDGKPCTENCAGTSQQPFCSIDSAFDSADLPTPKVQHGDTILVQAGIYHESIRFHRGVTLRSMSANGYHDTIISRANPGTPATIRIDHRNEAEEYVIDGFTITGALDGPGISATSVYRPITIKNCKIVGNKNNSSEGGGIRLSDVSGAVLLENTIVCQNEAYQGGGLYVGGPATIDLEVMRCQFEANRATTTFGGGIRIPDGGSVRIHRTVFRDNVSQSDGGGLHTRDYPDAFALSDSTESPSDLELSMTNSLFVGNVSGRRGGAALIGAISDTTRTLASIENCTFTENIARTAGGALAVALWNIGELCNSIFWGDHAPKGSEILLQGNGVNKGAVVGAGNCIIPQGLLVIEEEYPAALVEAGTVDEDPEFCNPLAHDYHLRDTSPAIDAGLNDCSPGDYDLDGNPRIVAIYTETIDIGAYEYQGNGCVIGGLELACGPSDYCPTPSTFSTVPDGGTIDARQPFPYQIDPPVLLTSRQGIGSPNPTHADGQTEPIIITLGVSGAASLACWNVYETGLEALKAGGTVPTNNILSVKEGPSGVYKIYLDRPISAGFWSSIVYEGSGDCVWYASLPGDANASRASMAHDIAHIVNCANGIGGPCGEYNADINHSGYDEYLGRWANGADITRLIDLLNGAGQYTTWVNKTIPAKPASCPGSDAFVLAEDPPTESCENEEFAAFLVGYLVAGPHDGESEANFLSVIDALVGWVVDHFSAEEVQAIVESLADPNLTFASEIGQTKAEEVITLLSS